MFVQVTGLDGAHNLAETLRSRGVKKLEFVSDEGLTVFNDVVPGIKKPVAVYVGINMTVFVVFFFSLCIRDTVTVQPFSDRMTTFVLFLILLFTFLLI